MLIMKNTVLQNKGGFCMQEKVYHTMRNIGIWNIVLGIVTMVLAIGVGVIMLVGGSKLLSHKSDLTF